MSETRLRRSQNQRVVAGVIGGLAEYFDRDPVVMRVLYVLVSILSAAFPGILVYLILWVIIPSATTSGAATAGAGPRADDRLSA